MRILFTTILLFQISPLVFAQDWETKYKDLCSYDHKWCGKVKNSDGTWVKPKKEILKLLQTLEPVIREQATKLNVDPKAIAGSILAENSLNVGVSDDVQDFLVKVGIASNGNILGKKFTFGLGQLNFDVARSAENYMAKIENRKAMTDKELSDALLIPEKAIYYVGAVIRETQDIYKKHGFDISDKPDILATLYNLGKPESKAIDAKKNNRLPRVNYFGFFIAKNDSDLAFLNPKKENKPADKTPALKVAEAKPAANMGKKMIRKIL